MSLPIEKSTYRARAVGAGFGMSDNHNPQLAIQFEVVDHDQLSGESIAAVMFFTEKTTTRSIESLQILGFASDDLELLAEIGPDKAAELLPSIVEIVCEPEEYDGKWSLRVKWINRPGGGKFTFKNKLEGSDLKGFAAQMKGALRNARGAAPRAAKNGVVNPAQSRHPNAPNAPGNDDIPF